MTTHYGLNPSFCTWASRLPLLSSPLRRAREFEMFSDDGRRPLGVASRLTPEGFPVDDGRWHGVRIFGDMAGAAPGVGVGGITAIDGQPTVLVTRAPSGDSVYVSWRRSPIPPDTHYIAGGVSGAWHRASLAALAALRPSVLRTLDWQRTNERPDWRLPRVRPTDALQGTDRGMAVELQAQAANLLKAQLWWCAPPRFELAVADYEARLEEMLVAIRETARQAPILEYGNELWNSGFEVSRWLADASFNSAPAGGARTSWQALAAQEIATLKRVADRVFGAPGPLGARPYYLFVGGQLTVPSHLDRILSALADLGVTPDLAGPGLYITPLKAHLEEWVATGAVPTQDELRSSCFARLEGISKDADAVPGNGEFGPLAVHNRIRRLRHVPYFACYEAGQSLIAGSHPWRASALAAQRTEWMGELYRGIRRVAEAAGVDLLNWYSAATSQEPSDPRVDVFGLLESTDLTKMLPKARAARGD